MKRQEDLSLSQQPTQTDFSLLLGIKMDFCVELYLKKGVSQKMRI